MVSTGDTEISLHRRSPRFRSGEGGRYSGVKAENPQSAKICLNFNWEGRGGGYSGVRTENTQSAKICLNFNFMFLCFYTCLSVILFTGGCLLWGWGVSGSGDAWSRGVSARRGCLVQRGSAPGGGGAWSSGGAWSGGGEVWRLPRDGNCCGRYASYWNAFLFEIGL